MCASAPPCWPALPLLNSTPRGRKARSQKKDSVVYMLGLVRQLVAVPDKLKAKKQVYTSVSRMDDKATFSAFPDAQVSVPLGGQEVIATLISEKPEYYPVAGAQNLVAPGRGGETDEEDEQADTDADLQADQRANVQPVHSQILLHRVDVKRAVQGGTYVPTLTREAHVSVAAAMRAT